WLMRNEIYAKHGKPFKTYELYAYFLGKGYKLDQNFSEKKLSKVEKENAVTILRKEKELLEKNYRENKTQLNFNNVINRFQFPQFDESEIRLLENNGFVVTPAKYKQLFHAYEENDYNGIASFITTDLVLQMHHVYFDTMLKLLEERYFLPAIKKLSFEMMRIFEEIYSSSSNTMIKDAAKKNMAYFAVPYYFLTKDEKIIPQDIKNVVLQEIKLCEEHKGLASPFILNPTQDENYKYKIDYSQFVPRGHYTSTESLQKYFMAMMWFGTYVLHPSTVDSELIQGLLITHSLYNKKVNEKYLIDFWEKIYEPTVLYVGLSDDFGPLECKVVIDKIFGKQFSIDDFTDAKKLIEVKKMVKKMYDKKTRIKQKMDDKLVSEPEFSLMGQRYIPDSEIMQRLVKPRERVFPKGLDVMAAFGSRIAKELMLTTYKDDWKDFPKYPDELEDLIAEYKNLKPEEWKKNIYYNWLWCLKSLLELDNGYTYPFFMNNDNYLAKNLNCVLASWTEMRHDTILYSQQSNAAECGGDCWEARQWIPEPPKGYVEPNVEFYYRLKEMLQYIKNELKKRGYFGKNAKKSYGIDSFDVLYSRFIEAVEFLEQVSVKELNKEPLTIKEYEQIRRFGSLIDNLSLEAYENIYGPIANIYHNHWASLKGPDRNIPLVTDVHTALDRKKVLEEAVGNAFEIYVIVEINGRLKLTRGSVFSYYEFKWPMGDRLTDEKWQDMLEKGVEPGLPEWTQRYFSDKFKKMPKPTYIPDSTIREHIGDGEPGWRMLYYETGC
ncbi:DUF3160 domain-containing protein, partial [bacterium]